MEENKKPQESLEMLYTGTIGNYTSTGVTFPDLTIPPSVYIPNNIYYTPPPTTTTPPWTGTFTYPSNYNIKATPWSFMDSNGAIIVTLENDGSVEWANDEIKITEAAEALSKSMQLGGELAAGITQGVKNRMRDSVFGELINIAKEKGSLTAEDLTYLLAASKIMEKLKGVE